MDNSTTPQQNEQQPNQQPPQQPYQQPQYQQQYQQPPYQQPYQQQFPPVSTGEWFLTMLLMWIPLVNIILLLVWAFGSGNPSKSNWAKAKLIWMLIGILIAVLLGGVLTKLIAELAYCW